MWRMTAAARDRLVPVIGDVAKEYPHSELRELRDVMVWKLDGPCEYDIPRPLTSTGTNLLGLVKHLSIWESRYFGEVFDRPFPKPLPGWDEPGNAAPICGQPSTRHARRSSIATAASGRTRTRQSLPSPSMLRATCPGGHVPR